MSKPGRQLEASVAVERSISSTSSIIGPNGTSGTLHEKGTNMKSDVQKHSDRRGTKRHKWGCLLVLSCLLTVIPPGCRQDDDGSASDDPNAFTTDAPVLDQIEATIGPEGAVLEGLSASLLAGVRL